MSAVLNSTASPALTVLAEIDCNAPAAAIVVDAQLPFEARERVTALAIEARLHLGKMQDSASAFCVALYRCRDAHGHGHWENFAKRNFPSLSDGNVRAAVRSGKMIALLLNDESQRHKAEQLSRLSRSALIALSSAASETIDQVHSVLADPAAKAPTAAQINEWRRAQLVAEELAEQSADALKQANDRIEMAQQEAVEREAELQRLQGKLSNQAQMALNAEGLVVELRGRLSRLERTGRTPIEAIEYRLPPGVESEHKALKQVQAQIAEASQRRDKLTADVDTTRAALLALQTQFESTRQTVDAVAQIQEDVARMLQKYPRALAQSLATRTPAARAVLAEVAGGLRALADQLVPGVTSGRREGST